LVIIRFLIYWNRRYLNKGFWFKIKAEAKFKPEAYTEYFEDLNFAPNAEIGPEGTV